MEAPACWSIHSATRSDMKNYDRARKVRALTLLACGLYGIWSAATNIATLHAACSSNIVRAVTALSMLLGCNRE